MLRAPDTRRVAILVGAAVATFLAVLTLTRMATDPGMELLYGGLDPAAAGEVIANLDAQGVPHEVRGDAIYVDAPRRDALRLQLAGEGLPRGDGAGYELLDGLSGFGTTSQMFDAAYWRAREGELTRTILAAPGVRTARVHVATADASPFSRDRRATASVTVQMRSGAVGAGFARALQQLVAGAVPNLAPDDVTVVDAGSGHVVGAGPEGREREALRGRSAAARAAVENLLAARVGEGRYVVELSIETREDRETITERILDPESRLVLSTDSEERSSTEQGGGAAVTVASNLPDGAAAGGEREATATETRERVNYDFSATERRIERAPGAIDRITVAVMVDGLHGTGPDGAATWQPRGEDELAALRELVQSAVGYREERGDVVTVRSMEFGALPTLAEPGPLSLPWLSGAQAVRLGIAGMIALVAVAALAFFVRPTARALLTPALPEPGPAAPAALPSAERDDNLPALPPFDAPETDDDAAIDLPELGALPELDFDASPETEPEDPVERLRKLIEERREETVEVLRSWMEQTPEGRG
jgi:flagellar M-ring protein FliF